MSSKRAHKSIHSRSEVRHRRSKVRHNASKASHKRTLAGQARLFTPMWALMSAP